LDKVAGTSVKHCDPMIVAIQGIVLYAAVIHDSGEDGVAVAPGHGVPGYQRAAGPDKHEPAGPVVGHRGLLDHAVGGLGDDDAEVGVVRGGELVQAVCGPFHEDADAELLDGSAHDGEPVMASHVEHTDVAGLPLGAGVDRRAVAVDGVAVEIEGDVVSANDDAVVGAVDQVAVQRRVGGDGVAAAHVAGQRLAAANNGAARHHQGEDHRPGNHRLR
jgi:hypothetical protein